MCRVGRYTYSLLASELPLFRKNLENWIRREFESDRHSSPRKQKVGEGGKKLNGFSFFFAKFVFYQQLLM